VLLLVFLVEQLAEGLEAGVARLLLRRAAAGTGVAVLPAAGAEPLAVLAAQRLQRKAEENLLPDDLPEIQAVAFVVADDHVAVAELDLFLLRLRLSGRGGQVEEVQLLPDRHGIPVEAPRAIDVERAVQVPPDVERRVVHDLDVGAQAPAGTQGELGLAVQVEGGGIERLVEIEAFRWNPEYVNEEHGSRPQTYKFY